MGAIDTNVLVRLYHTSGPETEAALHLAAQKGPLFVSQVTLAEAYWVWRSVYKLPLGTIAAYLADIAVSIGFQLEPASVEAINFWAASPTNDPGFSDVLIWAASKPYGTLYTFEKELPRLKGVERIPLNMS